jgi:hypothetical protein
MVCLPDFRHHFPFHRPLMELEQCYRLLNLPPSASLDEVNQAYLHLSYEKLSQGAKGEVAQLKQAYRVLKQHFQQQAEQAPPEQAPPSLLEVEVQRLVQALRQRNLQAQVSIRDRHLHIGLNAFQVAKPKQAIAQIYTLLEQIQDGAIADLELETVHVYGLRAPKQAAWQDSFPMPSNRPTVDDMDVFSFRNRWMNILTFPTIMLVAMLLNGIPLARFFLQGIQIWIHELGHATVAWLAGRRAIPLPFGWTNVQPERSLFVYLGVLTLFGLLFWSGYREKRRWPMVLAVVLAIAQFILTWLTPAWVFEMWLAFGGVGGEFYLSTLFMVSFYFPMPERWRWDFWRYPVGLASAYTFWGSFWMWQRIDRGREDIPWGSMWGGAGDGGGDMNMLVDFGWSDRQIIDTYNSLGGLCLLVLLGVYGAIALRQHHRVVFAYWQRWLARSS